MHLENCWPLAPNGPLEPKLLSSEWVRSVLFERLTIKHSCSSAAIRQGVKNHLKRTSPQIWRAVAMLPLSERDNAMANVLGNDPVVRSRIAELTFVIERETSRYGKRCTSPHSIHPARTLSELLWNGFSEEPENKAFVDWCIEAGIRRPDINSGIFLTDEALRVAVAKGSCPVDIQGETFAKAIMLFGGLLPRDEAASLFRVAAELGCQRLALSTPRFEATGSAGEDMPAKTLPPMQAGSEQSAKPRLNRNQAPLTDSDEEPPSELIALGMQLRSSGEQQRSARKAASAAFAHGVDALVDAPLDEWAGAVQTVDAARSAVETYKDRQATVLRQLEELRVEAFNRVGVNGQPLSVPTCVSDEELTVALIEASAIVQALRKPLDRAALAAWRCALNGPPEPADFHDLTARLALANAVARARADFRADAATFARSSDTATIAAWLTELNGEELAQLVKDVRDTPWTIGGAILLRAAIDVENEQVGATIAETLIDDPDIQHRRMLMRFVDPSSSNMDTLPDLRRVLAAERLRDILYFGPLAQISDPASGLSDIELVGRTVVDLAELITINLGLVSRGNELQHLLRSPTGPSDVAARALVGFIQAPATLTGLYRRLRECAREMLLLPLLQNGEPNLDAATKLGAWLATGEPGDKVFAEVQSERSDSRLESRHREQLDRYLGLASRYIDDFLVERRMEPRSRMRKFRQELMDIVAQLRQSNSVGTVEWLENQLADMLRGIAPVPVDPTLIGNAEPVARRRWESRDGAGNDGVLDLPEFHMEAPLSYIDVAASILHWRHRGGPPTRRNVVEELIARQEYAAALSYARDNGEVELACLVQENAAPAVNALKERRDALAARYGMAAVEGCETFASFETALLALALEEAADRLELLEIDLEMAAEARTAGEDSEGAQARRDELRVLLEAVNVGGINEHTLLEDLEQRWQDELERRSKERCHLLVVEEAMAEIAAKLPELESSVARFTKGNLHVRRWLAPLVAENLADLAVEALGRMKGWAEHVDAFRPEERQALPVLAAWFMDFAAERAETLKMLDDQDSVNTALERVLAVGILVQDAKMPSAALSALRDAGEAAPENEDGTSEPGNADVEDAPALPERLVARPAPLPVSDGSVRDLPELLTQAIREERWLDAATICIREIDGADVAERKRLLDIRDIVSALDDRSPRPRDALADQLVVAAAWISSDADAARLLPESRRIDIAFCVLTGVLAADSEHDLPRLPSKDGSWAELVGRGAPFRRLLASGLPPRTARVLESLTSGALAEPIALKLWDAITTGSEPQAVRTPLLTFLHEHGGREAILRLAGAHDPGIAPRLEQLFDVRGVAANRPDLVAVAQALAGQISAEARTAPFRDFVRALPTAAEYVRPSLSLDTVDGLGLRSEQEARVGMDMPIVVRPVGLVPAKLEATLFADDDVTFADGSRRRELTSRPLYFASDFSVQLKFGRSWFDPSASNKRDAVRLRVTALTVTGERISADTMCTVKPPNRTRIGGHRLDDDTLLEHYPGVTNTPAVDSAFVGRIDEIERLTQVLITATRPSPVLLTGMRRIGKTSLLFAFHKRFKQPGATEAITFYLSLAERKVELENPELSVARTVFRAISHAIARTNLIASDHNYPICAAVRAHFGGDWRLARKAIQACYDEESLADSLMALSQRLIEWTETTRVRRVVFLIDEAEALVAPYQAGGRKRLELEQFLQSLREISQNTENVGLLLSGSNHINVFTREYKNAFFGSSQVVQLEGLKDVKEAAVIICPAGIAGFIQFERSALESALEMCAGMPQFLWQVGATTSFLVRSGPATRADVRSAVAKLVGEDKASLPFKSYEVLEPIESMLQLHSPRERDLLWMLLFRVAVSTSLVAPEAFVASILDSTLLSLDDKAGWVKRLLNLVELRILVVNGPAYRFTVPLFAEGFRAPKNWQEFDIRLQQVES